MKLKFAFAAAVVAVSGGHAFARPENSMAFNAVVEAFLSPHLGGRAEPIGDDLTKSTADVRAGAGGAPGLAEAVKKATEARGEK
ncbi:MAG: hypothetical protein IT433_11170 [Phycisphaerales bacterium]|nr:hypothetical protein [Phycisphaerales bacterium]